MKNTYLLLLLLVVLGCEQSGTKIVNEKWKCTSKGLTRDCVIEFSVINSHHLPIEFIIRIRAHNRKQVMGSDAIQNIVVGDKVINTSLRPGEEKHFKEKIKTKGRVTSIIITITNNEL